MVRGGRRKTGQRSTKLPKIATLNLCNKWICQCVFPNPSENVILVRGLDHTFSTHSLLLLNRFSFSGEPSIVHLPAYYEGELLPKLWSIVPPACYTHV